MSTRTPQWRRVVAGLLMLLVTACHTWQGTTVSPQSLITAEQPAFVRVTVTGGEIITVRDPMMRNDSIVGATDAGVAGVASRDVRLFEVRRFSVAKTIGLGVLLNVLGGLVLGCAGRDDSFSGVC